MARIRTIKPEFCTSAQLAECSRNARLLFVLMWMHCDDNGVHPANAKQLRMECFPGDDDLTTADVQGMVNELKAQKLLVEYEHGDHRYLLVTGWKHQRIDKPQPGKHPSADHPNSTLITGALPTHSENAPRTLPPERKGKERKGKESTGEEGKGMDLATGAAPPPRAESKTAEIWQRYSAAYLDRYGTEPVRNAKVNGQLANVVDRLGGEDAPLVAEFYVGHSSRWYVEKGHSVECLQKDAEKLRTEWATGNRITATKARQLDKTQANGDVWGKLIAEAEEAERAN